MVHPITIFHKSALQDMGQTVHKVNNSRRNFHSENIPINSLVYSTTLMNSFDVFKPLILVGALYFPLMTKTN